MAMFNSYVSLPEGIPNMCLIKSLDLVPFCIIPSLEEPRVAPAEKPLGTVAEEFHDYPCMSTVIPRKKRTIKQWDKGRVLPFFQPWDPIRAYISVHIEPQSSTLNLWFLFFSQYSPTK